MSYDKDRKGLMIRVDTHFPEEFVTDSRAALSKLLAIHNGQDFFRNDLNNAMVALLSAMTPNFGQWCAISGGKWKIGEQDKHPGVVFFENGLYINIESDDPDIGTKIKEAIQHYLTTFQGDTIDKGTLVDALSFLDELNELK